MTDTELFSRDYHGRTIDDTLYLVVDKSGGECRTIGAALELVPYEQKAVLLIRPGVYCEKLLCRKRDISLLGQQFCDTVITYSDAAEDIDEYGQRLGTFRSYTAFFIADNLVLKNLTFINTADRGQGIAAAVDAKKSYSEGVRFVGWQDTLFTAPLPKKEFIPGGFRGPGEFEPRRKNLHTYNRCRIEGDVDFIFGGATALFRDCEIICRVRPKADIAGYIAAPSTDGGELGYLFLNCSIESDESCSGGFYLGRPWRENAAAHFINCQIGKAVKPERFVRWNNNQLPRFGIFPKEEGEIYGTFLTLAESESLLASFADVFSESPMTDETRHCN